MSLARSARVAALISAVLLTSGAVVASGAAPTWQVVASPNATSNDLNDLSAVDAIAANDVWSVGFFRPSVYRTLAEHWNGTGWTLVRTPDAGSGWNFLAGVSGASSSDVWAVGHFVQGSVERTLAEHWNGTGWGSSRRRASVASTTNSQASSPCLPPTRGRSAGGATPPASSTRSANIGTGRAGALSRHPTSPAKAG